MRGPTVIICTAFDADFRSTNNTYLIAHGPCSAFCFGYI